MSGFESVVGVNPWTALFTFCNMMISFMILKHFLLQPVKNMIEKRQKDIDSKYDAADRAKNEAEALKANYQQHLASAKAEYDGIMQEAADRAHKQETEILAAANAKADAIREKAVADATRERKAAFNEVKDEISSLAMDIAAKVVEREIKTADHQRLVEEFIGKIGEDK